MLISCSFFMAAVGLSTALGALSVALWNSTPLKWICEYGESPDGKYEKRNLRFRVFVPPFSLLFLSYCIVHVYFRKEEIIPLPQLFLMFCLLQLSVSDIKFHILQDQWILAITMVSFWFSCTYDERLWGFIVPFLLYGITALLSQKKKNGPMFGMGDIKLLGCLGFCFGPLGLYVICCVALLSSGLCSLGLLLLKKTTKKSRIAFGPFIGIACIYFLLST